MDEATKLLLEGKDRDIVKLEEENKALSEKVSQQKNK
jgi:hypothetical protein